MESYTFGGKTLASVPDVKVVYAFNGHCFTETIGGLTARVRYRMRVGEMLMTPMLVFAARKGKRYFNRDKDLYWYWMHCWVCAIGEDGTVICGFGRTYKLALNSLEIVAP